MTRLPQPIKDALRDPVDEVAVQRMWRGVQSRRAQRLSNTTRTRAAAVLAVAACALLALGLSRWPSGERAESPAGALRTAAGGEITVLTAPADAPRNVALSDGSMLALSPGARLEPLENTGHSFVALLTAGDVTFDVRPGGPRRWSLECGLATVEVLGTRFRVERDEARVRVDVERGTVLVRGERVPDRVRRLAAGESLEVRGSAMAMAPAGGESPVAVNAPSVGIPRGIAPAAPSSSDRPTAIRRAPATVESPPPGVDPAPVAPPSPPPAPPVVAPGWRDLARDGSYREAYGSLGAGGIARAAQGASADELLALADVARLSGHPADAVGPLETVLHEHAGEPSAPLAAFTLGRVQLDALGQPGRAAAAFDRAIALGVPRGLMEDAYARRVEARARSGDAAGARRAADEYFQRFPDGRHAAAVRRWAPAE